MRFASASHPAAWDILTLTMWKPPRRHTNRSWTSELNLGVHSGCLGQSPVWSWKMWKYMAHETETKRFQLDKTGVVGKLNYRLYISAIILERHEYILLPKCICGSYCTSCSCWETNTQSASLSQWFFGLWKCVKGCEGNNREGSWGRSAIKLHHPWGNGHPISAQARSSTCSRQRMWPKRLAPKK